MRIVLIRVRIVLRSTGSAALLHGTGLRPGLAFE
jgi:hypothetical protein